MAKDRIEIKQSPTGKELALMAKANRIALKDLRKPWRIIVKTILRPASVRAFSSKTGPAGTGWDPLTVAYANQKAAAGGSIRDILVLSGRLRKAATSAGKKEGAIRFFGRQKLLFGTDLEQAAGLFHGFDTEGGEVDGRPWLAMTKDMERRATDEVEKFLVGVHDREAAKAARKAKR